MEVFAVLAAIGVAILIKVAYARQALPIRPVWLILAALALGALAVWGALHHRSTSLKQPGPSEASR